MDEQNKSLIEIWKHAYKSERFFSKFLGTLVLLISMMILFSVFTDFIEQRAGIRFQDPILEMFAARDLTWAIFTCIYGAIIAGVWILLYDPNRLRILFLAYTLMVFFRLIMMSLLPLDPPAGMILLQDPFVSFFVEGKTLTRDLFFSGHTATMFLLFLTTPARSKKLFLFISIIVAAGVLLQKVHYTIDVLVAPFISFASYFIAVKISLKEPLNLQVH